MKKMNLNILIGLLLTLLVAGCTGTGTSLHFGEGDPEEKGSEEKKRQDQKNQEILACQGKAWGKLEDLVANKERIIPRIGLASFASPEQLWKVIEPFIGENPTELLGTLIVLGNHYNAYETLLTIVNELKDQDQVKARWLVGKLIKELHGAAEFINDNDREKFALIKNGNEERRKSLHIGVTRIMNLAIQAGIHPENSRGEKNTVEQLRTLKNTLGFKKWFGQD